MLFFYGRKKNNDGFTLVEVLIVLAIFSSLTFLSAPIYFNFSKNTYFSNDLLKIENLIKRTRQKSFSSLNNSSFGFFLDRDVQQFIFYEGNSFIERSQNSDIIFDYKDSLKLIAPLENIDINFFRGSGRPDNEILFLFETGEEKNKSISINKYGAIILE